MTRETNNLRVIKALMKAGCVEEPPELLNIKT